MKSLNDALRKFAHYVISQSRANLTRKKKNVNRKLYDSIHEEINVSENSFSLSFIMEEYGIYQDRGVSGTEKIYDTPFRFKKMPPVKPIANWAKARHIRFRDEKGRYTKGNYNSIGFVIARSIKKKGLKPSLFFTKPFEKAFSNLPNDLIEAFDLTDVDGFREFVTKKNFKI